MLANLEEIHPDSDFEKSVVPQNRLLIFLGYHNGFITGSPTLRAKNSNNEFFNLTNSININPSAPLPEPEESSSSIVEPEESSSSIVEPEESSSSTESEISPNDDYIYYGYVEIIDNSDSDYGEYYAQNITWEQMQNNGEFQKISIEEIPTSSVKVLGPANKMFILYALIPEKLNNVLAKRYFPVISKEEDFIGHINEGDLTPAIEPSNGENKVTFQGKTFKVYGETWLGTIERDTFDILIKEI